MPKEKLYMICDFSDKKAAEIDGTPNVGVEFMGNCSGRIVSESGDVIARHFSSSYGWLRADLKYQLRKLDPNSYELIDLIGLDVLERFKKGANDAD